MKKGGSIKMWRELFTQESRIFGVDIDPAIPSFPLDANIKTMVLDSSHSADLVRIPAPKPCRCPCISRTSPGGTIMKCINDRAI